PNAFDGEIDTHGGEGPISAAIPSAWNLYAGGQVTLTQADGAVLSSSSYGAGALYPVTGIADRYGNTVAITGTYPAFNYVDTLNRSAIQDSGFAVSPETLTVSGL